MEIKTKFNVGDTVVTSNGKLWTIHKAQYNDRTKHIVYYLQSYGTDSDLEKCPFGFTADELTKVDVIIKPSEVLENGTN